MNKTHVSEDNSGIALVDLQQGQFEFGIISETGIVFRDETAASDWSDITKRICAGLEKTGKAYAHFQMLVGDALKFGEEKYGEDYADVIDATREWMRIQGIEVSKNWQWVAGKIPPHIRRINLSFAHHELVAKYEQDEQEEFLKLAEEEALTVRELRDKVKERHPGKPQTTKVKTIVKIDTDNPEAVTDALQIIANHLSDPKTEILEDWKEHLAALHKVYRRNWQNGHAKAGPSR